MMRWAYVLLFLACGGELFGWIAMWVGQCSGRITPAGWFGMFVMLVTAFSAGICVGKSITSN